ncbi:MAG: restriction endonuclease subunit S [Limnospira sp. PMC 1279.21]|uniref:restriction endonuclease subunit S n=1 Tax=unclassified Limnospira TaxID=2642885 RepID=UPI0028E0A9E8|nr:MULTISPECIES: restriction endonuclease subunit S [unclassified Limnospira]MDT9223471.1 restriction endonuclease subunit S [Limnospira sp. PMC 1279.21]MDT9265298.1 restriction endonuclease subunit S [Limnospira sp. PMC 1223.20]MDT9285544.1 restriction endonuclease subunit S [Limnospira sp. PMC 1298.21]
MSELPKGWVFSSLLGIVNLHDSQRIPLNQKQRAERQGAYPYYGANGQVDSIDGFIFDGNYILLAEDGGYFDHPFKGVAYEVSGRFWVNNHAHILSPCSEIPIRFLFYVLNSLDWMPYVGGSTRLKLTQESMRRVLIPLPPLNEQRRIVAKLDRLFARSRCAREELGRVSGLVQRYKQVLLVAATSGEFSEDWQTVDIQSVAKVGTGSTPLKSNSSYYADDGIPWITSAATGQPFVTSASEFVTEAAISDHRLKKYPVGTLLVAMYGEGKTRGQVTELGIEATINQACAAIVVDETLVLKEYLKLSLKANYLEMRELAEGGNQPNLNLSKIKNFPVVLPSLQQQKKIVKRVEKLFKVIDIIEQEHQKASKLLDRLEKATLSKAFRGELVPQDPNDEPAAVLLERIQAQRQTQPKRKAKSTRKPKAN